MFARQLYKQAAITPSSCREFRTLLFANVVPPRISRAHPELPRLAPSCLTLTMTGTATVIIYHILLCVLRTTAYLQFSCPIHSKTPDYMDLILRAVGLNERRFYTDSHLIDFIAFNFESHIIAFLSISLLIIL